MRKQVQDDSFVTQPCVYFEKYFPDGHIIKVHLQGRLQDSLEDLIGSVFGILQENQKIMRVSANGNAICGLGFG